MVRVATDHQQLRGARISLLSALGAGVLIVLIWISLREPAPPVPAQRTLVNCRVEWVCERDAAHRFVENGRFEPLPCRSCNGRCYIRLRYVCPDHKREFDSFVQFERVAETENASGLRERVVLYRYKSADSWRTAAGHVPCPVQDCTAQTRRPHTSWSERSLRAPDKPTADTPTDP